MIEKQPSYIDSILSTHFNECSIAAADASRMATELFANPEKQIQAGVQLIGEHEPNQIMQLICTPVAELPPIDHPAVLNAGVKFMLARLPGSEEPHATLGAMFNGDMFVPVAAFAKRANGQCSYVQLGQEIEDDNLVVTQEAPRQEYVEAIRTVLKTSSLAGKQLELVESVIFDQLDMYAGQIERLLPSAVCRAADRYFETFRDISAGPQEIFLLDDNETQLLELAPITLVTDGETNAVDGRAVTLALARGRQKTTQSIASKRWLRRDKVAELPTETYTDTTQLLAIVRGNVAIRLAGFNVSSGVATLGDYDQPADTETLKIVLQNLDRNAEFSRGYLSKLKHMFIEVQSNYLVSGGRYLYSKLGYTGGRRNYELYVTTSPESTRADSLDDIRQRTLLIAQAGRDSWSAAKANVLRSLFGDIGLIEAVQNNVDEDITRLIEAFGVAERLSGYIGTGETATEKLLVESLGKIATKGQVTVEGVLTDRKAGKTRTDVATKVSLSNANGQVRVHITGRPVALDGFEHVTLFDESLSLRHRNDLPDDKVREMAEVLTALLSSDT